MKQKLILLLKTLFASKGFSQKALEGLADYLVPNLTEESTELELTAAIEGIKPMTDVMQSEINRQVNAAKPIKVDDPINPIEPAKPAAPADDMPEWAKALVQSTQALAQGFASIQAEKVGTTRREQNAKTLEGTSAAFKTKALKDFDRMSASFKDDEDFNSWLTDASEDAKVFVQEEANSNLGGDRPNGGFGKVPNGEKEVSPLMKDFLTTQTAKTKVLAV